MSQTGGRGSIYERLVLEGLNNAKNNTMGLDFSVSCATFHPTCRKVETQYMSLMNLLDSVSSNMEKQYLDDEKSGYEWAKKSAKESSGGEEVLYQYIYGQNCAAVDGHLSDLYDIQNMFYKSMLSTVYYDEHSTVYEFP